MVHSLINQPAPSFSIPDSNGQTYNFVPGSDGVPIALFFYPKTGSYGCSKEACQFQTLTENEIFKRAGVRIVGVSSDSPEKQKAFVQENNLTYPLLSDESGEARKAYKVGNYLFTSTSTRTTFVIDRKGVVRGVLDATMNFNAHSKFVHKEMDKLDKEEKDDEAPTEATGAAAPSAGKD